MATKPPSPNPATASDTATAAPPASPAGPPTRPRRHRRGRAPARRSASDLRPRCSSDRSRPYEHTVPDGRYGTLPHRCESAPASMAAWMTRRASARTAPAPPGPGVFCEACGRNLADVERLPTARELAAAQPSSPLTSPPTGASVAKTVREFLETMARGGQPRHGAAPVRETTGVSTHTADHRMDRDPGRPRGLRETAPLRARPPAQRRRHVPSRRQRTARLGPA